MFRVTVVLLLLALLSPLQAQTLEEVVKRIQLVELGLEIGNPRAATIALEQLQPENLSDQTLGALFKAAGLGPEMVPTFRFEVQLAELTVLEMSGLHSQVLKMGTPLLKKAKDPEQELHLRLLLIQAGRKGAFPKAVQTHLSRAAQLAPTIDNNFGKFSQFLTQTFQFESRRASQSMTAEQVLSQAENSWALWEALPLGTKDLPSRQWRWGFDAVGVWREALMAHHSRLGEQAPAGQIMKLLERQESELSQRAGREGQAYRQTLEINIGYVLGFAEETLNDSRRFQAYEMTDKAAERLARANHFDPGLFHDKMTNRALSLGWREEGAFPFTQFSEFYVAYGLSRLAEAGAAKGPRLSELLDQAAAQFRKAHNRAAETDFLIEASQRLLQARPEGWLAKAQEWTARSLELSQKLDYRPARIVSLINSAEILGHQNKSATAIHQLEQAIEEIERYLSEAGSGHHLQGSFQRAYDLLTEYQLGSGQGQRALESQLRARQVEQLESSRIQQSEPSDSQLSKAVKANRRARTRLRAAEQEAQAAVSAGQPLKAADQAKADFYRTLEDLKALNPRYADYLGIRPINFARLKSSIPADTALIVISPGQDKTHLFVLTDKLVVRETPIGYKALTKQVYKFRRAVTRSPQPELSKPLKTSSLALHQALIDPIEKDLAGKKVLAFVPTRSLTYLPMSALARSKGEELEFLAERFQVVTVLKDADLEGLKTPPSAVGGPFYAFGNPDGTLPAAGREASGLAELFPKGGVFLKEKATEESLSRVQGEVSILHLATHGVLKSRAPQSSYLVMAGEGQKSQLTLAEVYGLDLKNVSLVTLSACQTSLGEQNPGSEVSSLATAFTIASADSQRSPTVVASLWQVDDEATAQLMMEFYSQLKSGLSKGEAMQKAQLKLLATEKTRHPYYWAPFLMIGDWR